MSLAHPARLAVGFLALGVLGLGVVTKPVSIHLNATVLMVNVLSLGLTCTVPRHPDNRGLHFGIQSDAYLRDSFTQLDGDQSRVTFGPTFYSHLPCGEHTAYCTIERLDHSTFQSVQRFQVVGCNTTP